VPFTEELQTPPYYEVRKTDRIAQYLSGLFTLMRMCPKTEVLGSARPCLTSGSSRNWVKGGSLEFGEKIRGRVTNVSYRQSLTDDPFRHLLLLTEIPI